MITIFHITDYIGRINRYGLDDSDDKSKLMNIIPDNILEHIGVQRERG